MKIKVLSLFFVFCIISTATRAQDDAVSDDDLRRYAVAMDSIEQMKKNLIETISDMVKGNENVSASRYNDLSKIIDDESKLTEAEATETEIAFIKAVAAKKEEETAKINETFQSLAKDYVGVKTYNAVKKALKEDDTVKEKYNAMLKELSESTDSGK